MDPQDAALQLPGLLLTVVTTVGYFLVIMLAQFSIFFGPFLLYARIGLDATDPGMLAGRSRSRMCAASKRRSKK